MARTVAGPGIPLAAVTCAEPFVTGRVLDVKLAYPSEALRQRGIGFVLIDVALSATGAVTHASVAHGSGWPSLDQATLEQASAATYAPQIFRCEPTPSELRFEANYEIGR